VGFGIGPIFSGLLRDTMGFDAVFVGMAALMGSSAVIVAVLLPGRPPEGTVTRSGMPSWSFRVALRDRLVLGLTILMGLTSLTFGAVYSFLSVRLDDLGVTALLIGLAFAAESLASGAAQPLFGRIADRVDRKRMVMLGLGASALALAALGAVDNYGLIVTLMFALGLAQAVTMVAVSAMQVVAGRRAGMGTVIGLGSAGNGIGIVFGAVAGGALVSTFGLGAPFYFGATSMLVGVGLVSWMLRGVATTEAEMARREESKRI